MEELISTYKQILLKEGYITESGDLTEKADRLLGRNISIDNVQKFRNIFPPGILPSGKPARSGHNELTRRFYWFLENFNYDWDTIYQATEEYVKYFAEQGYKYMQTAAYFIVKQGLDRIKSSTLAEWCDRVLNKEDDQIENFDINI